MQQRFRDARVVKSLNQLGYHQVDENRRPAGTPDSVAIGAAGDDLGAMRKVMRLVDRLGFDPVDAGPLENGRVLEPDGSPVAPTYNADELRKHLARAARLEPQPRRDERSKALAADLHSRRRCAMSSAHFGCRLRPQRNL